MQTHFFLLADTHLTTDPANQAALRRGLETISKQADRPLVVINGDLTNTGDPAEYQAFAEVLGDFSDRLDFALTLGNHDVRGPRNFEWTNMQEEDPQHFHQVAAPFFLRFLANAPIRERQGLSYTLRAGSARLIFLNTEKGLKDAVYLPATTLNWLDRQLTEDAGPHLVFLHEPLNDTHRLSDLYGGTGQQDALLKDVLRRHPDTFFLSGHIHNAFGVAEAIPRAYATCIDTPAYGRAKAGLHSAGCGYEVTLDDAHLTLAAWDLANDQRLPEFDVALPARTLGSVWADALSQKMPDTAWLDRALPLLTATYSQSAQDVDADEEALEAPLFGAAAQTTMRELIETAPGGKRETPAPWSAAHDGVVFATRDLYLDQLIEAGKKVTALTPHTPAAKTARFEALDRLARMRGQLVRYSDAALQEALDALAWVLSTSYPIDQRPQLQQTVSQAQTLTQTPQLTRALMPARLALADATTTPGQLATVLKDLLAAMGH
ncbi:metallophosphoesterase family protein [Lacticaseibacillus mingshuiensis]|uniref:metallophosphoesterase family protein n=1 Tax=Lacticaseibacillus mingshuiensis TaxID=2799574 RepID=UPI00194E7B13|nr:metallophosphoesterase [Lacticaseibacillus mingshuiensis]